MKRSGLQIAAGVCEIIAGALMLLNVLFIQQIINLFGLEGSPMYYFILYGLPTAMIIDGAMFCTGKRRRKHAITSGILDLMCIGMEFYTGLYKALGLLQIILLIIAACLLFFAKKPETEPIKKPERQALPNKAEFRGGNQAPVNNLATSNSYSAAADTDGSGSAEQDMMVNDDFTKEMIKLTKLRTAGILTEEEYTRQKMNLIQKYFG